jgi:hypothetical protein
MADIPEVDPNDLAFLREFTGLDPKNPDEWDTPELRMEYVYVARRVQTKRMERKEAQDALRYQR